MKRHIVLSIVGVAIATIAAVSTTVAAQHSAVTEQPTVAPVFLQNANTGQQLQNATGAIRLQDAASASSLQPASH